ncbi:MAG: hypothetical protein ACR2H3_03240 [Acidimicrobiales bacterium]
MTIVVLAALSAVLWLETPAQAHEVRVVVACAMSVSAEPSGACDGIEGLELGIDESPDVGHAPGPDAGDHLGGVDVEVLALDPLALEGAEIVVILEPAEVAAVARELAGRAPLLIAVLPVGADIPAVRPDRVIVLRLTSPAVPSATVDFAAAFVAVHERPPTAADQIGYDVSQVLDAVLAETDGDLLDLDPSSAIWPDAQRRLTSSVIELAFATGAPDQTRSEVVEEGGRSERPRAWMLVLLLPAAGLIVLWRRSRHPRRL